MNRNQPKFFRFVVAALLCSAMFPPVSIGQNKPQIEATVSKHDGLETVEFDTLEGVVIDVNLPDDIEASDTISGTVVAEKAEPANTPASPEIAQNEDELNGYVVEIGKTKELKEPTQVPVAVTPPPPVVAEECPQVKPIADKLSTFSCLIAPVAPTIEIRLINPLGVQVATKTISCGTTRKGKPTVCTIPPSGTCEAPLRIPGPCDGRSITSSVKINGNLCPVLAESPRQQVCLPPKNVSGKWQIVRSECGRLTRGTISMAPPRPKVARKPRPKNEEKHGEKKAAKAFNLTGSWSATTNTNGKIDSATVPMTQTGNTITMVAGLTYTGTVSGNTITFHNELPPTTTDWVLNYDPATDTMEGQGSMKSDTLNLHWTVKMKR